MPGLRKVLRRNRGFTPFPGDPWTGPGNDPFIGPLNTLTAYVSRNHDNAYAEYEKKFGTNPKYYWNDADREAIREWDRTGEWSGRIAAYVFKAKKFLHDVGIVPGRSFCNLLCLAESRHAVFLEMKSRLTLGVILVV